MKAVSKSATSSGALSYRGLAYIKNQGLQRRIRRNVRPECLGGLVRQAIPDDSKGLERQPAIERAQDGVDSVVVAACIALHLELNEWIGSPRPNDSSAIANVR